MRCSARNRLELRSIEEKHTMQVNLTENLDLEASPEEVWKLLRDVPRLAALLPGVESVTGSQQTETYTATVTDRIGPFKISMNLDLRVTESVEPSLLKASIAGADPEGMNR